MLARDVIGVGLVLLAGSTVARAKQDIDAIPITPATDNYAHISVRVNGGTPLDFIFDTGASVCVVTELGKAKLSELKFDAFEETLGSGGSTRQPVALAKTLSLGQRGWTNQKLMFIDYHGSLHADGVIGYNLFANQTISLEFDRGVLNVYDRLPEFAKRGTPVNVTMKDDLAFIPITLAVGSASTTDLFAVDTGYGGAMTIASPLAQAAHLPGSLPTLGTGKTGGTGSGSMEITAVRIPRVNLGGVTLRNVPADVQLSANTAFKTWNIVGNEVIKRFNLVWDIKGKKMYLPRNRNFSGPFPVVRGRRPVTMILVLLLLCVSVAGVVCFARWKRKRLATASEEIVVPNVSS